MQLRRSAFTLPSTVARVKPPNLRSIFIYEKDLTSVNQHEFKKTLLTWQKAWNLSWFRDLKQSAALELLTARVESVCSSTVSSFLKGVLRFDGLLLLLFSSQSRLSIPPAARPAFPAEAVTSLRDTPPCSSLIGLHCADRALTVSEPVDAFHPSTLGVTATAARRCDWPRWCHSFT